MLATSAVWLCCIQFRGGLLATMRLESSLSLCAPVYAYYVCVCKTNSQTKVGLGAGLRAWREGDDDATSTSATEGWVGMRCTDQMYVWMDHGLSWLELASAGIWHEA